MKRFPKSQAESSRERIEDALKHLLDCDESGRGATLESLAGALGKPRQVAAEVLGELRGRGLAGALGDSHRLTEDGRVYALQVVRSHRLYETWLARETGTPADSWHREAHKAEHLMNPDEVDALADLLNHPRFDPHGDPIPTREGHLPKRSLVSLASWPDEEAGHVEHIEDEPEALFRRIQTLGLAPGTRLDGALHLADGSVECTVEGRRLIVPSALASLIHLERLDEPDHRPEGLHRLSDLPIGGDAVVYSLSPSCNGAERRRLLDLGVVPGTRIHCEFASPFGSPRSYLIRGALIALRNQQAERILVHPPASSPP